MIILKIFFVFAKIGLFAIGGAYSFLPLLDRELVTNYHWLSKEEFLDVLGIARIFPGAISVKYATYTGYKIGGILGVIAANLGNIFAPALIIFLVASFYFKYKDLPHIKSAFNAVQLAVFAMLIALAIKLVNYSQLWSVKGIFITAITFILFIYGKIHPALIIIGAGIAGYFFIH